MHHVILFFFLFITHAFSFYTDPEIEDLLLSLSDPYNLTLEDYRLIEHYYEFGERPYLAHMVRRADYHRRMGQLRNFKLVGSNGEMPVVEFCDCNVTEKTNDRCIIIYGSYNPGYAERVYRLLGELKQCGYSGHILARIGGIPDISHGGARLATTPYTWRVDLFKEAVRRGFTKILYMDARHQPRSDLSKIFAVINNQGVFSYTIRIDNNYMDWVEHYYVDYLQKFGIPFERYKLPWFSGTLIGLNFTNGKVCELFQKWDEEMHQMEGFCTIGDDVPFTCIALSLGFWPSFTWEEITGPIVVGP